MLIKTIIPANWDMGDAAKKVNARPDIIVFIFAYTMLDSANLSKSVLDACEKLVFHTDASVKHCSSLAQRTTVREGGVVAFAQLPANSSSFSMAKASYDLQVQVLEKIGVSICL